MPRRTVTVAEGFDKAIRGFQAKLLKSLNTDVTFTEALNIVLYMGLMPGPDKKPPYWREGSEKLSEQDINDLLKGFDLLQRLHFEGLIDNL